MPHYLSTEAIVIAVYPARENDRRIELLTPSRGRIFATARGARKLQSPFISRLQPLNECEMLLYENTAGNWTIVEAKVKNSYSQEFDLEGLIGRASSTSYVAYGVKDKKNFKRKNRIVANIRNNKKSCERT